MVISPDNVRNDKEITDEEKFVFQAIILFTTATLTNGFLIYYD